MSGFFERLDEPRVVAAIHDAEKRSRGEVRVHITNEKVDDAVASARTAFEKLGMTATKERNGVLIFVAPRVQKFAILGDSGITGLVGTALWDELAASMSGEFRAGRFTEGLLRVIERAGDVLAAHFPPLAGALDQDELPNEISRE